MSFCNSLTFYRIWTSAKTQPISNVIWQSHGVHLVNINVYAKFHHNIPLSSRYSAIITFSEFGARQSLDRWKMSFRNLLGQILSISMFTQKFIKIFHTIQKIGPFSLFQNLALGKASTDDKCNFQFLELDLVNINVSAKFYQNIPNGVKVKLSLFFRIWTTAKPRPIQNVIWLSHGLHHVNINVYAIFHHNIPLSSRDRAIFTFSEFGARQSLDRWKMSFRNLLG